MSVTVRSLAENAAVHAGGLERTVTDGSGSVNESDAALS